MVYVVNFDGLPLMPCSNVIARLLLKQKKAKCVRKTPFTIKLLYQTTNYIQDLTLGIDTGSSKIGSAVTDENNNIFYLSEIEIRNDIDFQSLDKNNPITLQIMSNSIYCENFILIDWMKKNFNIVYFED